MSKNSVLKLAEGLFLNVKRNGGQPPPHATISFSRVSWNVSGNILDFLNSMTPLERDAFYGKLHAKQINEVLAKAKGE